MDETTIRQVLNGLGLTKIKNRGTDWIVASCPFSPISHPKKRDSHPSFAVRINPIGTSGWTCYTCHKSGWIGHIIPEIERALGVLYSEELHILSKKDDEPDLSKMQDKLSGLSYREPTKIPLGVPERKPDILEVLPESYLDPYRRLSLESLIYLKSSKRRLTSESIVRWGFGWDDYGFRVVIPIRNSLGQLVGISRRHIGAGTPKYLHSKGFKRDLVLYGEHLIDRSIRRAYIVEGFFDANWMDQCGFSNTLAIMGSYISVYQGRFLKSNFDEVVVVGDGDIAGVDMSRRVVADLTPDVRVTGLVCPEGRDPNDMSKEELCHFLSGGLLTTSFEQTNTDIGNLEN